MATLSASSVSISAAGEGHRHMSDADSENDAVVLCTRNAVFVSGMTRRQVLAALTSPLNAGAWSEDEAIEIAGLWDPRNAIFQVGRTVVHSCTLSASIKYAFIVSKDIYEDVVFSKLGTDSGPCSDSDDHGDQRRPSLLATAIQDACSAPDFEVCVSTVLMGFESAFYGSGMLQCEGSVFIVSEDTQGFVCFSRVG